jgi:nucleotide-binding universal stress UspA family protein
VTQDMAAGSPRSPGQADAAGQVIVVGLDGSPASWDAFWWAAGEALRSRGRLIAAYITPAVEPVVPVGGYFGYAAAAQARQEAVGQLKEEAERRAAELGVPLAFVQELGAAAPGLASVARAAHADLVVVGRSAKMLHHLAGSAGRRLVSRHDAPVVVVVP